MKAFPVPAKSAAEKLPGAAHGVDVPYVFENLAPTATAEDRHISETSRVNATPDGRRRIRSATHRNPTYLDGIRVEPPT